MRIGLMDQDLQEHSCFPNLELMKISSFFKQKNEIVKILNRPDPTIKQLFIAKDLGQTDKALNNLFSKTVDKTYIIGKAIYPEYRPLPSEIEVCPQDTSIYENLNLKEIYGFNSNEEAAFRAALRGINLRLSIDGKTIWDRYRQQLKKSSYKSIIIHDYNAGAIENGAEEVQKLYEEFKCRGKIRFKFPLKFWDFEEMAKWFNIQFNPKFTDFEFYGLMTARQFEPFLRYCAAFPPQNKLHFTYCPTGAASDENDFVKNYLPEFYLQLIKQRKSNVSFFLKYEKGILTDPRWNDVFTILQMYERSTFSGLDSSCAKFAEWITNYSIHHYQYLKIDPFCVQNAFSLLKEKSPETYTYIYSDDYNLRRILTNDKTGN